MAVHPDPYDLLKSIIHLSTSSISIETKLDGMLQILSDAFESDRCLVLRPDKIGKNGFLARLASERKPLWVEDGASFQREGVLSEEKDLLCPSFACIPLYDETSFQAILYIGFSKNRRFSSQETDLILLIAKEMEEAIRNAHLHQKAELTISELTAFHEMGKAVTSTLKLRELFDLILATGLKTLKAKGGVLRVEDRRTGELEVRCSLGEYHLNPLDEKIARRVFHTRTPLSLHHFSEEKPSLSILCAPFLSKGKSFGTLTFYDKEADSPKFDERDFQLLLTMANQVSCAIENALVHYETSEMAREHEKRVKQLSTLWELNKALLTTVNFERIVHMTLTAITIGDGLGFNRAMLFMVNEKKHILEGTLAVGPDSAEEAGRIWSTLSQRKENLSNLIAQIQLSPETNSILNSIVKGIQIPLEQEECILSRTVLEGRPFNIRFPYSEVGIESESTRCRHDSVGTTAVPARSDSYREGWLQIHCERGCSLGSEVGCYVSEHLSRDPKVYSFATVPLWGKGKVIGVILVDNLYNQNPVTDGDIQFLIMFTNQAGLAIENTILYRNLEEVHRELQETQALLVHQEKMVALGELSTHIAHEIKNPLVSIGGFARRLDRAIPDESQEKRYTETIIKEVERLERILDDIHTYTHDESLAFKEWDLRDILEESVSMVSEGFHGEGIQIVKQFAEEPPKVRGDYHQLKEAFSNLISNAYQAMDGKGTLSIRIHPISKDGSSFIRVEVQDTGNGIDPENLHNIFNPFYSTKDARLGLGLPIVHKIILSHRGQIEVDNTPGEGVTFIITLPVQQPSPPPLAPVLRPDQIGTTEDGGGDSGEGERPKNSP
jgi:signal transduction histidine kinase